MAIAQAQSRPKQQFLHIERQLQLYRDTDLHAKCRERLGPVIAVVGHFAEHLGDKLRRDQRLFQVTLTKTFTSVAPLLVHLNAGGITLTAAACYPNNS